MSEQTADIDQSQICISVRVVQYANTVYETFFIQNLMQKKMLEVV